MLRNVGNWHEYLLHKSGLRRREKYEFRLRHGLRADTPVTTLFTFKEIFFTDDYFRHLPRDCFSSRQLNVLDIGANVGFFSLRMFAEHPHSRIVAVEPIPANFAQLQVNKKLNADRNWTLEQAAVASRAGSLKLMLNPDDEFTTDASVLTNPRGDHVVEVPAMTLADVMAKHDMPHVDYLKLDCEGAEYDILYDSAPEVFENIACLVVETHPFDEPKQNRDPLAKHLESYGYRVVTDDSAFIWAWRPRS